MNIIVQTDEGFHCLNLSHICSVSYYKEYDKCYVSTIDATEYEISKESFDKISSWLDVHNEKVFSDGYSKDKCDPTCTCGK